MGARAVWFSRQPGPYLAQGCWHCRPLTHHFSQRREEGFNLPHQPRPIKPYSTCMKPKSSPTRYLGAVQYPPCCLLYVVITLKPRSASWVPSHRRVPTESRSGAARRCAHPIPWPRPDGNGRGRKASQCGARHTVTGNMGRGTCLRVYLHSM